jgi:hypothetical protein
MSKRCISCKAQLTDTTKEYCSMCEWKECRTNKNPTKKESVILVGGLFIPVRRPVQHKRMVKKYTVVI